MKLTSAFLLAVLLCGLLAGCGGSHNFSTVASKQTGRATLTIRWPARLPSPGQSRLIPAAANSIKVEVKNGNVSVSAQVLPRPSSGQTSTVTFDPLPVGNLTVTATSYPQTDGSGVAQATATIPLVIQANQNTPFTLTMNSVIDHLEIAPSPATVSVGQSLPLTVTAKDATGAIVLISAAKLQWSSGNATASVDASGNLSGLMVGTTGFSVTEQESGKAASVNVTVTAMTRTFIINGQTYRTANSQETLTAAFTPAEGGATVSSYQNYVVLDVSGVGQAYNTTFSDAFYLYTGAFASNPSNGFDGGYYQLAFGTSPLGQFDLGNNAKNNLVGPVPPYNPNHTYTVILNTTLSNPGQLHFGVSDGTHDDNTGAYTITVTQLVLAP